MEEVGYCPEEDVLTIFVLKKSKMSKIIFATPSRMAIGSVSVAPKDVGATCGEVVEKYFNVSACVLKFLCKFAA